MKKMRGAHEPKNVDKNSWEEKRIYVEFFSKELPKTCENFHKMLSGENDKKLKYHGSHFHTVSTKKGVQMLIGGDVTKDNGTGGATIFGPTFDAEKTRLPFCEKNLIAMKNVGPGKISSQFVITFAPIDPSLEFEKEYTVIGRILEGIDHLITNLNLFGIDMKTGKPLHPITLLESKVNAS
jgi:cyclophilin family peptidyl-prolyl cis-trans isomerase